MKFIRDIIGEKRQTDPAINGTKVPGAPEALVAAPGTSSHYSGTTVPQMGETKSGERNAYAEQEARLTRLKSYEPDLGLSDDVAKFFAESDEIDLCQHDLDDSDTDLPDVSTFRPDAAAQKRVDDVAADAHASEDAPIMPDGDGEAFDEAELSSSMESGVKDAHGDTATAPDEELSLIEEEAVSDPPADDQLPEAGEIADEPEVPETSQPEISAFPPRPARPSATGLRAEPDLSEAAPEIPQRVEVPQPAVGRGASRHGRVKTRLLGFSAGIETDSDPMADNEKAGVAPYTSFPVGWLIVIEGPGRGSAFTLFHGVSTLGRGEDQTVRLDFGDNSISRESHASVAYDDRKKSFFIGHGGKANIVRRNDRPVLSTEELAAGDRITIGETSLRFVPFCSPEFSWEQETATDRAYANQG